MSYKCECGTEFEKSHQYNGHKASCRKEKKKCFVCNKSFIRLGRHICRPGQIRIRKSKYKKVCPYCDKLFDNGYALGGHKVFCKLNPNIEITKKKIGKISKNRKLSEKTKKKISKSRINYLLKNPNKVPYLINNSSKISYPEQLFINALKINKIDEWVFHHRNGIYQYDFAFINLKIDVEVDGSTHLSDKVKKIDERRDLFSQRLGWEVIRFTANDVKRNVNKCINILKLKIEERLYKIVS